MFDMLDDDLDIGYVPTINNNSRSGSMKKLTKKQPKVQSKQTTNQNKNQKKNDYDDLLDDLLDKQYKSTSPIAQNKKPLTKNFMANSYDSLLDEPKAPDIKPTNPQPQKNSSLFKGFNNKNDWSDDIISQDIGLGLNFGKNQSAVPIIKNEEVVAPTRNMKPPLKKRTQSNVGQSISFGGSLNLLLPEQSKVQSKIYEDQTIIKPPPRLMNKRSSIDKNQDLKLNRNDSPSFSLQLAPQPSKSLDNKNIANKNAGLKLSFQQSNKIETKHQKIDDFTKPSYLKSNYQFKKQQSLVKKEDKNTNQFEFKIGQPAKKNLNLIQDQSVTFIRETISNQQTISTNKAMNEDFERQINEIKKNFQRQIDFIQQNLEKQIYINKQTREKLMRQSDKMIQQQRKRSQFIHQQEIKRMKQIFQWQKARMQQNYKRQINSLRQNLEFANKNNNLSFVKPHYSTKQDTQYQQIQLKNQKKLLEDRQKILQKREIALEERQIQMAKRKRKQQQRLRMEQKRIIELQSQIKLQKMRDKKVLDEQKHHIALQMAKIQIQNMRRQQKIVIQQKSHKIDKKALQNQKVELRGMNADLIQKYKQKIQQIQIQRQHIKQLEEKLIEKIRIVQKKGKQFSQTNANKTTIVKKQNNWLQQKDKSHQNLKKITIQKQDQDKSLQNAHKTKERFHNIEDYAKSRMNGKPKDKEKFNIEDFLVNVGHHNKIKA